MDPIVSDLAAEVRRLRAALAQAEETRDAAQAEATAQVNAKRALVLAVRTHGAAARETLFEQVRKLGAIPVDIRFGRVVERLDQILAEAQAADVGPAGRRR